MDLIVCRWVADFELAAWIPGILRVQMWVCDLVMSRYVFLKGFQMKKWITIVLAVMLVTCVALITVGCNKQVVDLTYSYEYAILSLPNGEIVEGKVSSWTDYEDGDQIQVKIAGKVYLVHSSNIVLISE